MNINLIMYKEPMRMNFGDELSPSIFYFLLQKYKVNIRFVINKKHRMNVCFIGSLISWSNNLNYNNLCIFGSGIRNENDQLLKNKNMKIFSVRGPLSKLHLEKYGYHVPNIFGDPALLLPQFYKPKIIEKYKNKIGVVGHLTNFHKYSNLPENFVLINPTWLWTKVVDYICSCKIILSSSLHGLIISDAYKIPNIWLNEYALNEGTFKFKDYFQSQNRELINIHSIFDYNKIEPYTNGNIICLDQLESSFIDMCIYMWNYK